MTSLITVAVIPVILMQLLSFSLSSLPLRSALRAGLKGLRDVYKRQVHMGRNVFYIVPQDALGNFLRSRQYP